LIAGYFLYLPIANIPPMKVIRNGILTIPLPDQSGFEYGLHPWVLLFPDFAFAIALLGVASLTHRGPQRRHWTRPLLLGLLPAFALGGAIASLGSESPGVSVAGLIARIAVLLVAWVIASRGVTEAAVRLWLYALFFGLAVILANGLIVYLQIFGWPDNLAELPVRRSTLEWERFGLVTWGHAANTSGVLLLTMPVAVVLFWSRRGAALRERIFLGGVIALMAVVLLVAFQRWALICVLFSVFGMLVRWRGSGRSVWLILLAAAVYTFVGRALVASLGDYFVEAAVGTDEASLGPRIAVWIEGIRFIFERPAGVGFEQAYRFGFGGLQSSHNLVIDATLEGGLLVGLATLAWLGVIVVAAVRGALIRRSMTDTQFAMILGAATYSVFGIFFNGQVYLAGMVIWFGLWILLPTAAYALEPEPVEAGPTPEVHRHRRAPVQVRPTPLRVPHRQRTPRP